MIVNDNFPNNQLVWESINRRESGVPCYVCNGNMWTFLGVKDKL